MSLRTNLNHLQAQAQQVTAQRDSLMRLLMQVVIEHGGDNRELVISHTAANALNMQRLVIDTVPAPDGRMAIRYRDVALSPQIDDAPRGEPKAQIGLALVPDAVEPEPEEKAPPCTCTHDKDGHIAGIGSCRRGSCWCEAYDPAVTVA